MKLKDLLTEDKIVDLGIGKLEKKFVTSTQKLQAQLSKELTVKYKGKDVTIPLQGIGGNRRGVVDKVIVSWFSASQIGNQLSVYFSFKGEGPWEVDPYNASIIVHS